MVVAAVVAGVIVLAVPRLRAKMLPHVMEGFGAVKGSLTDPERLMKIVGGTLTQKILFALTLAASVAAYGESLPFGEAIFVNCTVSLFIGLVPVPGGIGVAEAALTAGLIAVGVPDTVAIAAAITHRMVTAYIPPVFGWWTSRWLVAATTYERRCRGRQRNYVVDRRLAPAASVVGGDAATMGGEP